MTSKQELAVLLVEDSESDAALATAALERAGYSVVAHRVQDGDEMKVALSQGHWDIVLCDHVLPGFDSLAALELVAASDSDIPLIVVSGAVGEEAAAAAVRHGAADFVSKDHLSRLAPAVSAQLRAATMRAGQRRAEAQFQSAFDDAPFGTALISLDPDAGRMLRANRALCEATGFSRDQLLETHLQELLHADERHRFERGLDAVFHGRKHTYRAETRLMSASGSESWFLCSISYVRAPGGCDAIAHFVDIDARKRVEETLHLAHQQALEASRLKSEFVVNMSHELRTPLNGVIGLAGLLADTPLTNAQDAYVAGIRTSGHALMGVIGGILDFSKIEAGTLTIEPVEFEPAETVAEVCALLAPTVKEKRLDLRVSVDAAVPDRVRADAVRIRQVLTNLAGNAVKFTDAGEVAIRVALGGPDSSQLRFDVTDAGPGIEPGARPFEPFWQADSSMTRHHGGTGLGLAIAERMVELMGGEIHFESASSGGCHFWFTVTYENAPLSASAGKDLAGVRALLVDRDANRRAIVERQLNSLGLVVTASDDVDGALGALNTNGDTPSAYGVLIQGCSPADANIATQLEAMRATPLIAETPVLMIASAAASPAIAAEVGADCTLTEPFGPSLLAHAVVRAMGVKSGSLSVAHPRSRGRLLLVEDDAINQLFAVDLLKRDGWEVEVAEDGGEAVELALKGGYDAILMDCQMPKVDGYRATEEIRRLEGEQFHTPIIAVTAHATARDRQRCIGAGMDAYVAKPFTTAQLESALHEGLNGSAGSPPRAFPRPATPRRASHRRFTPILDRGKLAHTDPAVAKQLVELFSRTSRQRISELEAALIAGDGATIRTLGHTLKGAAATIGAHQMAAECERLRASVTDGVTMEAHARHAELERIFLRTEVELDHANREAADV